MATTTGRAAFPRRVTAMIDEGDYGTLREQAAAHGYQTALLARWLLMPGRVGDMQPGGMESVERMMRRPMPSGTVHAGRRDGRWRDFRLTEAEYEALGRMAARHGLIRSVFLSRTLHEQVALGDRLGWPMPEGGITNEGVDSEVRAMLDALPGGHLPPALG